MAGGSFAWINPKAAVIGCGIRVNREGAEQVTGVRWPQGVELLAIDLVADDIHIDGSFLMIDGDLALVDPIGLPFSFLEKRKEMRIRPVEMTPADNTWITNSLAVAPGEPIMPEGATNRTLDSLAAHGIRWTVLAHAAMQLYGGGIHCSTTPQIRDETRPIRSASGPRCEPPMLGTA